MAGEDNVLDVRHAVARYVDNEQDFPALNLRMELLETRVGHRSSGHACHPCPEEATGEHSNQHRNELRAAPFRWIGDDQRTGHHADCRAEEKPDPSTVYQVGLLEVSGLVQIAKIGATPGEEAHVAIVNAGQQQVIGRASGTV
jgi:hypothetical protein